VAAGCGLLDLRIVVRINYAHQIWALANMLNDAKLRPSKQATNLSIDAALLKRARAHDINLSATLEQALRQTLQLKQREQWLQENKSAIDAYNLKVEEQGAFSDGVRSF
jgi:antitoxin CcdA